MPISVSTSTTSTPKFDCRRLRRFPENLREQRALLVSLHRLFVSCNGRSDRDEIRSCVNYAVAKSVSKFGDRIGEEGEFWSYCCKASANTIVNHHQMLFAEKRGESVTVNHDFLDAFDSESPSGGRSLKLVEITDPDEHLLRVYLLLSLEELEEADRRLLELQYFDDLDLKEIAEVLGVSPQTASCRCQKALTKLIILFERKNRSTNEYLGVS